MIKKIIVSLLIALSFISLSEYSAERIIYEAKLKFSDETDIDVKPDILYEGKRYVYIGMSYDDVLSLFGDPKDSFLSEYGFIWNIFHVNFKNYIQIGVQDSKVVGIYTNSPEFFYNGISVGTEKAVVNMTFETPITYIKKGNTRFIMNGIDDGANMEVFMYRNSYITFFYDSFKNNSVTSVNIIDYDVEQSLNTLYADGTYDLKKSFEVQNFYLINAVRVRHGLYPLNFNGALSRSSFNHSQDMAKNGYFSHTSLSGETVVERVKEQGISYSAVGENIAMGAQNSIYMNELLMNSEGHRKNILADFKDVGTGVAFSDKNVPYLTQNFKR